ncbi:hypothetical protein NMG60_11031926 [Bertholletia excelsa]
MGNLCENLSSLKIGGRYSIDGPWQAETAKALISPAGELLDGTIGRSKTIVNILRSPLFRQSGMREWNTQFGRTNLIEPNKSIGSDSMSSPGWFSMSSKKKLIDSQNDRIGSEPAHKRLASISSTNSTISSDQSSSSMLPCITQAMLHCIWKDGFPHYVFSLDDKKEVYVGNIVKASPPDDKVFDYMYTFHLRAGGRKEHGFDMNDSDLVGKMRVSTTYKLCPNNSEIKETEFVLFGEDSSSVVEAYTSSRVIKKNKGLSKKMVEVLKGSHTFREITSKYVGTSTIPENFSMKACPESANPSTVSDSHLPPNLELAAIIMKDHICGRHQEAETGGWGLKFLKNSGTRQSFVSAAASPECCLRNIGDCSTSLDVLVPAGLHGGPRNGNGVPSSLTERWRSDGHCDCGGWDIGCPLTILKTKPNQKEVLPQADSQDCKSFDLFIQGSKHGAPVMKVVNIHDGLYFVHFQSTLSALQSFSIAVAIIHTKCPALQTKVYRC